MMLEHPLPDWWNMYKYGVYLNGRKFISPSERQLYALMRDLVALPQLERLIEKDIKHIVDVGANIGGTALVWLRMFPDAHISCIEPVPLNVKYLMRNIPEVEVYEFCANDKTEQLHMQTHYENTGRSNVDRGGELRVQGIPLDNIIKNCDFLKIDVEGYELKVLEGAKELIRQRPYVLIETNNIDLVQEYFHYYSFSKVSAVDWFFVPDA